MKCQKLSPRIKLFVDEDENGFVGVLMLEPSTPDGKARVVSIEDQSAFRFYYKQFRRAEDKNFEWNSMDLSEIGLSE